MIGGKRVFVPPARPTTAPTLQYLAIRKIKKGDVLSFSYIGDGFNMLAGTVERQQSLRKLSFVCECPRCSSSLDRARGGICALCGSHKCCVVNRVWQVSSSSSGTNKKEMEIVGNEEWSAEGRGGGEPHYVVDAAQVYAPFSSSDEFFCVECKGRTPVPKPRVQLEQRLCSLLPHLMDAGPDVPLAKKAQVLLECEQALGKFHFCWLLACFSWLQSVVQMLSRARTVDISLIEIADRCRQLALSAEWCCRGNWVQRLRLLGLVAHVERGLFPRGATSVSRALATVKEEEGRAQSGGEGGDVEDVLGGGGDLGLEFFPPPGRRLPLDDPLACGLSIRKLVKHAKFQHLEVLVRGR